MSPVSHLCPSLILHLQLIFSSRKSTINYPCIYVPFSVSSTRRYPLTLIRHSSSARIDQDLHRQINYYECGCQRANNNRSQRKDIGNGKHRVYVKATMHNMPSVSGHVVLRRSACPPESIGDGNAALVIGNRMAPERAMVLSVCTLFEMTA
jgi:hypothetical protein